MYSGKHTLLYASEYLILGQEKNVSIFFFPLGKKSVGID
jgi:hypothetical protein